MLRGAVEKHAQDHVRSQRPSRECFQSSPPDQRPEPHQRASQSVHQHRNPLKPASASALNGARGFQVPLAPVNGVKRMASGLAKLPDGSIEHRPGSRPTSTVIGRSGIGYGQAQVTFDEDDFDSDIDLEFEEQKIASIYPSLSQQPAMAARSNAVVYPTLPKPQQAQGDRHGDSNTTDFGLGSAPTIRKSPPKSSNPLPWSSSPVEHFTSTRAPSNLSKFAFDSSAQAQQSGSAPQKASKRRTLPWTQAADDPEEARSLPTQQTLSTKMKQKRGADDTPLPKDNKRSAYPWNTTASAIKDQQKKFREENRKAIKKNEGTEETTLAAKSSRKQPARVFLSEEQQHVLELVTEQKSSVFFTGSAGTGKSVLLREIIASLRRKYQREPDRVAVTASTGLAACNVGGVTLHSFAGIGLGKEDASELVRKIKRNQKAKHRWMRTKVLVVDEVSMVDADLFDKLEAVARQLRNNGRPFGGIQLVITGDFFQLPPVPDSGRIAKFAFDAATWNTTIEHTIGLHHVFRQKDPGMLNEMREGRLTPSSIEAFRKLNRPLGMEQSLEATELFPTRNEVERANHERLHILQGDTQIFEARDGGAIIDKAQRDKLLSNCMAPESITLKKGAQVMLIKNIDEGLVNGSLGRVIGFMSEATFDRYHDNEDAFFASPGGTLASSTDDHLNPQGKSMVQNVNSGITTSRRFPVVRFLVADGSSRDLLCQPETWKVELPNGEVQASRAQVPLILAWALSIHKAQGQTLERVKVDLGKVFEKGQAYVALSRATSMAGLQVLRFDPKKVVAHDRVRNFYSNLSRVELAEKNKERVKKQTDHTHGASVQEYERTFVGSNMG